MNARHGDVASSSREVGFDLAALYAAVDAKREAESLTWAAVARDIGVAASTVKRFATAGDAEADGVLMAIRWLGTTPETFATSDADYGDLLPLGAVVRVDMNQLRQTQSGIEIGPSRARTTIQKLVQIAAAEHRSIASLTRISAT